MTKCGVMIGICLSAIVLVTGAAHADTKADPPRPLTKEQRIARNNHLVDVFYQAYVNLPKLGYADAWKASDYAEPYIVNGKTVLKAEDWKERDKYEYTVILDTLPDYQPDQPLISFCNEDGCAFVMQLVGHDASGEAFRCDEAIFMFTNEYGKITRFEGLAWAWYKGKSKLVTRVTGLSDEELEKGGGDLYQARLKELYAQIQARKAK